MQNEIYIQQNIPLAPFTTLGIGGNAAYFVEITTIQQLQSALKYAQDKKIPWQVIGGGSNLLISDDGFPGLIIKINYQGIAPKNDQILVKAGTKLQALVNFTIENELDGMSTMTGIPGTVGGAIYGSAGAYGDNIRDFLTEVTYLEETEIKKLTKAKFTSSYRDSTFKHNKNAIILEATFSGFSPGNKTEMQKESAEIIEKRNKKYPPEQKCPGSFFKNVLAADLTPDQLKLIPEDKILYGKIPAGFLLESVQAKGKQRGDIVIATSHANTFINRGQGTATDFYQLAKEQAQKVFERYGITLEPEVQFINLPPFTITNN